MILALLIATIYIALRNGAILFKIKIDFSFLHKKAYVFGIHWHHLVLEIILRTA